MKIAIVLLSASVLVTACDPQAKTPPEPTASPTPTPSESAQPPVPSSGARSVSERTDDYIFEYSYPAEAGNIPELAAILDKRLENTRATLARQAANDRQEARDNGFPYNTYSNEVAWKVVADLPGWLSLSSDLQSYTGGAHGMFGTGALMWDKNALKAMQPMDFFISAKALDDALSEKLCAELDKERAKRRGEPVAEGSEDMFDQCVSVEEATVLPGSAGHKAFDRLGIQIGPYVAGPYVEGSYEFTFPVDAAVIAAVKPEYRAAFAARN